MANKISAGGVIFKKNRNQLQILLLKDKNNHWTFPKGQIEKGEDELWAAKRETNEEVGLSKLKLICPLSPIKYWYKWNEEIVKKIVYYFLFEFAGTENPKPQKEEGISEVKWFALNKALKIIGYPKTNRPILEEVLSLLRGTNGME